MAESDKREAVLNAGRTLLLKQGFRATSMEAIAAEAGIAKATLYKYYGDKDAVFAALVTELLVAIHIEYGALYVTQIEIEQLLPFVPNEEISELCWWDGYEAIGEISVIDRKLIELV